MSLLGTCTVASSLGAGIAISEKNKPLRRDSKRCGTRASIVPSAPLELCWSTRFSRLPLHFRFRNRFTSFGIPLRQLFEIRETPLFWISLPVQERLYTRRLY